jgi:hypothetical protein
LGSFISGFQQPERAIVAKTIFSKRGVLLREFIAQKLLSGHFRAILQNKLASES